MRCIFLMMALLPVLWWSGCFSQAQVEMKFLDIQKVYYHDSGRLDIRGEYTQKGVGLGKISAFVKDETVELNAVIQEKGSRKISCRISVPPEVKSVKFAGKEIWNRTKSPTVKTAEKNDDAARKSAVPAPEVPPMPEKSSAVPVAAAAEKKPEVPVTVLQINADDFFELKLTEIPFDELFWGRTVENAAPVAAGVKKLGSRREPVDFNVAEVNKFPDLEVLAVKGHVWDSCDFAGLSLPKLKKLIIDDIEVKNLDKVNLPVLEEFYLNDRRSAPMGKISLPEKMEKLHTVGIQSFAGNFDYGSLQGKPVKNLRIHSDLRRFEFLKDLPVEKLQISGFSASSGSLDVLRQLPCLSSLQIAPYRISDWRFLQGMNLQKLDITSRTNGNFSPALLKGMPLESLRLRMPPMDYDNQWLQCVELPLKELVLCNAVVPEKFLLENSHIESLATINCRWGFAEPPIIFSRMAKLRHLAAWQIIYQPDGKPGRIVDQQISWGRSVNRNLRALAISALNLDFIRQMPDVEKISVRHSGNQVIRVNGLANRRFEVLFCPEIQPSARHRLKQDMMRYNIRVDSVERTDLFAAW